MIKMPQADGSEVLMAVLQRRGIFNTEKMAPESYPGCCQVTCHGGLEEGEDFDFGLVSEIAEELGSEFAQIYSHGYHGEILTEFRDSKKEVVTFGALMSVEDIRDHVRLGPDSGGLDFVREDEINGAISVLVEIKPEYKVSGPPAGVRAMFPDEIHAIERAFEVFGKK